MYQQKKVYVPLLIISCFITSSLVAAEAEAAAAPRMDPDTQAYMQEQFRKTVMQAKEFITEHNLPDLRDPVAIERSLRQAEIGHREVNTAAQGFAHIANSIASISRSSDGSELAELGSLGVSLASNMYLLSLPSATLSGMGIAPFFPYAAIAVGVCSLIFSSNGGNGMGKALAAISGQIAAFHHDVMIRFDYLEAQLDEHHRKVMRAFMELHKHQDDLDERIADMRKELMSNQELIKGSINKMELNEIERHREAITQFAQLRLEAVEGVISDVKFAIESDSLDAEKLVASVRKLYKHITIVAKSSSLSGTTDLESMRTITEALSAPYDNPYNHPAFSNINMIKKYCQLRCNMQQPLCVVNPQLWVHCVESLNKLLSHAQKLSFETPALQDSVVTNIKEIINLGQLTLTTIEQMAQPAVVHTLVQDCIGTLGALKQLTDQYMAQHVRASLNKDMIARIKDVAHADATILADLKPSKFPAMQATMYPGCQWSNCSYPSASILATIVAGLIKENEHRLSAWKDLVSQTAEKRIAALEAGSTAFADVPLSQLAFPSNSPLLTAVKRPVLFDALRVAPEYVQAELCGLGSIVTEFDITEKTKCNIDKDEWVPFYMRVYFVQGKTKTLLKECKTAWKERVPTEIITDDHVYGHIYGGARLTTALLEYGNFWDGDTMIKYLPCTVAPGASLAVVSHEATHSATIQQLVAEYTQKKRRDANEEIREKLESVQENPLSLTARKLDMQYKILESVARLIKNVHFNGDPACALFREEGTVKDRSELLKFMQAYAMPEIKLCEREEYLPLATSMQAFAETERALVAQPFEFSALYSVLESLRHKAIIASQMCIVPRRLQRDSALEQHVDNCVMELRDVRREQQDLKRDQLELKKDVADLRSEMDRGFGTVGAQLAMLISLQQKQLTRLERSNQEDEWVIDEVDAAVADLVGAVARK